MLERLARGFARLEDALLALLVAALVLLAGAQIVARLVFSSGLLWADPLLRALVLWTALLGAMAAAREGKHLAIDATEHLLPDPARRAARAATSLFAAAVAFALGWYGWQLAQLEREGGAEAFLGVPVWAVQLVLPFAFGVIGLRFLGRAWRARRPGATT